MATLSGTATPSKLVFLASKKGSSLKGKTLLPMGTSASLLEQTPSFSERPWYAGKHTGGRKLCLPEAS